MIKRDNYDLVLGSLSRKEITILIGARQVGKTTLLQEVLFELSRTNEQVLYWNLDIENDASYFVSQQKLLSRIQLEFGNKPGYVFIDEIQQKQDAGRFLKGIYDMNLPYKFIVTGSGSLELKEKVGEALTGRKQLINMDTVSFREFVDYKSDYRYSDRLRAYFSIELEKIQSFLNEYISFGGYPKVVISDEIAIKKETMNEVFTSYITKDISYLLGVRSTDKFVKMIKLLAVQSGCILNYAQLASDTGVSVNTLKNYLWYSEQTFIVNIIKPFYTNAKKELTKSPVVYFNDLGMLNFALGKMGEVEITNDFVFQNFVFNLLRQKYESPTTPINHWRTKDKAEVDFIIHSEGEIIPIEVKHSELKKISISRSFRNFIIKYQPKRAMIINLSLKDTLVLKNTKIEIIPYWELV